MNEDSQSWEDRCNRYFSSLSDTEKDYGQEKHMSGVQTSNIVPDNEYGDNSYVDRVPECKHGGSDEATPWKSLSEMRRLYSEHSMMRYTRKLMSTLDIHGARMSSRSSTVVEMVVWFVLMAAALGATVYLCYLIVHNYRNSERLYALKKHPGYDRTTLTLTFCNLNILKNSSISSDSRFSVLTSPTDPTIPIIDNSPQTSLKALLNTNAKLTSRLEADLGDNVEGFVEQLQRNVIVQELLIQSNVSLVQRLRKYQRPNVLMEVLGVTLAEVDALGYRADEMLVNCWTDDTACVER